jgi:hypothetical protein
LITPTPAPVPTILPPAAAIVGHAYNRMRSYGTPPYVVYLANENGDIYRIAFRATDEMMNQIEYNPHRTSLAPAAVYRAFVGPLSITMHEAIANQTPTPSPSLSITATATPSATASPTPMPTSSELSNGLLSDLKTIAVVSVHAPPVYKAAVSGVETIDGHSTERIELTPVSDPAQHTLRDLWIDTSTYDVRRADYITHDPNFPDATVYLTVNFVQVGPYWIAARWVANYHFNFPDEPPFYRELKLDKMRFPDTLPDWLFNQRGYQLHYLAGDQDPLAHLFDEGT